MENRGLLICSNPPRRLASERVDPKLLNPYPFQSLPGRGLPLPPLPGGVFSATSSQLGNARPTFPLRFTVFRRCRRQNHMYFTGFRARATLNPLRFTVFSEGARLNHM